MSHFAKVIDGIVVDVAVIEQEVIDTGAFGDPAIWIRTSYNTRGGIYYEPGTTIPHQDQSRAFRKNYAGIGFRWDADRDAFIPPQTFPSWVLDEFSCLWYPPVKYPDDGKDYEWDENQKSWVEILADKTPVENLP